MTLPGINGKEATPARDRNAAGRPKNSAAKGQRKRTRPGRSRRADLRRRLSPRARRGPAAGATTDRRRPSLPRPRGTRGRLGRRRRRPKARSGRVWPSWPSACDPRPARERTRRNGPAQARRSGRRRATTACCQAGLDATSLVRSARSLADRIELSGLASVSEEDLRLALIPRPAQRRVDIKVFSRKKVLRGFASTIQRPVPASTSVERRPAPGRYWHCPVEVPVVRVSPSLMSPSISVAVSAYPVSLTDTAAANTIP